MNRNALAALSCVLLFETGCATIFKGNSSSMAIEGLPDDATVETADGFAVDRAPPFTKHAGPSNKVILPANESPRVVVVKANGKETKLRAHRFVGGGWVFLDIVFGLVPLIIDASTGAWNEYEDTRLPTSARAAGAK